VLDPDNDLDQVGFGAMVAGEAGADAKGPELMLRALTW
jgi:hypothetical protein